MAKGVEEDFMKRLLAIIVLSIALCGLSADRDLWAVDYEIWALDQGLNRITILKGSNLEGDREVLDLASLGGKAPHFILFNADYTHAIVAYVGSGHLSIIRASDRKAVFHEKLGTHTHVGVPTPDSSRIIVANQNDEKITEIVTDYKNDRYTIGRVLDLKADPKLADDEAFPNRRPVCSMMTRDGSRLYASIMGGGVAVIGIPADPSKPLGVVRAFPRYVVANNGCGTLPNLDGSKMYVNTGTLNSSNFYVFDTETDSLIKALDTTSYGRDSHGLLLTSDGKYLWMFNRKSNNAVIFETATDEIVGTIKFVGESPDIPALSPDGERVYITLRGAKPVTGGPEVAGRATGITVIKLQKGGRKGKLVEVIPLGDDPKADLHGIAIRPLP
jgi:DNA-binding beta-propeller fold protein YncE